MAALQNILPVARVADLAPIATASVGCETLEMAGVRAFVPLHQLLPNLMDHPGSSCGRHGSVGISIDDFNCALFHAALIRTGAIATLPGGAAEIAQFGLAAAAILWSAFVD
jgi:hypothetical protein